MLATSNCKLSLPRVSLVLELAILGLITKALILVILPVAMFAALAINCVVIFAFVAIKLLVILAFPAVMLPVNVAFAILAFAIVVLPCKLLLSDCKKLTDKLPISKFPLQADDDKEGCIQIFEQPYTDKPVYGMYIAGIDPYDDDQSSTDSLGSIFIMHSLTSRIVAEYTGRPQTAKEFFEICRKLMVYYNAVGNYENNKKGLFAYFEQRNCLHLLCNTPKILKDQQIITITNPIIYKIEA